MKIMGHQAFSRGIKNSIGDSIYICVVYTLLFFAAMSCLVPIVHQIAISFSSSEATLAGKVTVYPVEFSIQAYRVLMLQTDIVNAFKNSIMITVVGTLLRMAFTILAAYPLSKSYMFGRKFFSLLILFTMIFNAGLIPHFLVVKQLGMLNTYYALWLPGLVSVYGLMVMRTNFEGVSKDLDDAARIDGCTEWRILWNIYLPLSKPVLAAMTLFYSVSLWNNFRDIMLYITDQRKYNLAVMIHAMIRNSTMTAEQLTQASEGGDTIQMTPQTVQAAGIVVLLLPMMMIYPWLQKYFVKGVMIGAIKG